MMNKLGIFFAIGGIMCLSSGILAQDATSCIYTVEGIVVDQQSGMPLEFANVLIKNTSIGTSTDSTGHFSFINLCDKEFDLVFSYVGYKSVEHHHDYHHPFIEVQLVPESHTLKSIVIEAEHGPANLESSATTKLHVAEAGNVSSQSLAEVVSSVTGVSAINTGSNISKPIIHGLHSNRILIVNEGLRHEFQNWGADHAPEIDPSIVDEIEIIKGAATVKYGPDALGGALLIKPHKLLLNDPFSGQIRAIGQTNGRSHELNMSVSRGYKWISTHLAGSYLKQGDLKTPDYLLTNTGRREESMSAGLLIHPLPELDMILNASHFHQHMGVLKGSVNGNLDDLLLALKSKVPLSTGPFSYHIGPPNQMVRHQALRAEARWIGNEQSFHLRYGYQYNHRQEFDVRRGNDTLIPNIDLELITQSLDVEWHHPHLGSIMGQLGIQYQDQQNTNIEGTNTIPFVPNYEQKRYGIYIVESLEKGPHLFEMGIRHDWQESDVVGRQRNNLIYRNKLQFSNSTATLGYKLSLSPHWTLRSNIGSAWRAPNVAELYRFGRHLSFIEYGLLRYSVNQQNDFISTRDILTQEDKDIPSEVGYKWINNLTWKKDMSRFDATAYIHRINNFIYTKPAGVTRTVRGTTPYYIYDQTDALIWGIDLVWEKELNKHWTTTWQGSYTYGKRAGTSEFLVQIPPLQLGADISFHVPAWQGIRDVKIVFDNTWTTRQTQMPRVLTIDQILNAYQTEVELFSNDAPDFDIAPAPDGYFLSNFSIEASVGKVHCNLSVINVFNVRYRSYLDRLRYFADRPGRNYVLGITYKW